MRVSGVSSAIISSNSSRGTMPNPSYIFAAILETASSLASTPCGVSRSVSGSMTSCIWVFSQMDKWFFNVVASCPLVVSFSKTFMTGRKGWLPFSNFATGTPGRGLFCFSCHKM